MVVKRLEIEDALDVHMGIEVKSALLNVLVMQMSFKGENVTLLNVCDAMAQGFVKSMRLGRVNELVLPSLIR